MYWPSHIAYPYIVANAVSWLAAGQALTLEMNILLILFSIIPDLDLAFNWLYTTVTGKRFHAGVNHHEWSSHWPISYVPLAALFVLIPNSYTALMLFAVMFHLALDSFACAWGVMWLYPFSKRWFNFHAERFSRVSDGLAWRKVWRKSAYSTIEWAALAVVSVHLVFFV